MIPHHHDERLLDDSKYTGRAVGTSYDVRAAPTGPPPLSSVQQRALYSGGDLHAQHKQLEKQQQQQEQFAKHIHDQKMVIPPSGPAATILWDRTPHGPSVQIRTENLLPSALVFPTKVLAEVRAFFETRAEEQRVAHMLTSGAATKPAADVLFSAADQEDGLANPLNAPAVLRGRLLNVTVKPPSLAADSSSEIGSSSDNTLLFESFDALLSQLPAASLAAPPASSPLPLTAYPNAEFALHVYQADPASTSHDNTNADEQVYMPSATSLGFTLEQYVRFVREFKHAQITHERPTLSRYVMLRASLAVHRPSLSLALAGEAILPALTFSFVPILPLRLADTPLAYNLQHHRPASFSANGEAGLTDSETGFLTMDEYRNVVPLSDDNPASLDASLVGIWVSRVERLDSDTVIAAALRFLFSAAIKDRVSVAPYTFLLLAFDARKREHVYWEVSCKLDGGALLTHYEFTQDIALPQAVVKPASRNSNSQARETETASTVFKSSPDRPHMVRWHAVGDAEKTRRFREAQRIVASSTVSPPPKAVISALKESAADKDSQRRALEQRLAQSAEEINNLQRAYKAQLGLSSPSKPVADKAGVRKPAASEGGSATESHKEKENTTPPRGRSSKRSPRSESSPTLAERKSEAASSTSSSVSKSSVDEDDSEAPLPPPRPFPRPTVSSPSNASPAAAHSTLVPPPDHSGSHPFYPLPGMHPHMLPWNHQLLAAGSPLTTMNGGYPYLPFAALAAYLPLLYRPDSGAALAALAATARPPVLTQATTAAAAAALAPAASPVILAALSASTPSPVPPPAAAAAAAALPDAGAITLAAAKQLEQQIAFLTQLHTRMIGGAPVSAMLEAEAVKAAAAATDHVNVADRLNSAKLAGLQQQQQHLPPPATPARSSEPAESSSSAAAAAAVFSGVSPVRTPPRFAGESTAAAAAAADAKQQVEVPPTSDTTEVKIAETSSPATAAAVAPAPAPAAADSAASRPTTTIPASAAVDEKQLEVRAQQQQQQQQEQQQQQQQDEEEDAATAAAAEESPVSSDEEEIREMDEADRHYIHHVGLQIASLVLSQPAYDPATYQQQQQAVAAAAAPKRRPRVAAAAAASEEQQEQEEEEEDDLYADLGLSEEARQYMAETRSVYAARAAAATRSNKQRRKAGSSSSNSRNRRAAAALLDSGSDHDSSDSV